MPTITVQVTEQELDAIDAGYAVGITKSDILRREVPRISRGDYRQVPKFVRLAEFEDGTDVSAQAMRDGLKLMVSHVSTDSLVVFQLTHGYGSHGKLFARVGMRGNWDVKDREIRWTTAEMRAPKISDSELKRRKQVYARLHPEHCCPHCGHLHKTSRGC